MKRLLLVFAMSVAACGGKAEGTEAPCARALPPPIVTSASVLRLDTVDFGEKRDFVMTAERSASIPRALGYGYDLDGLCSDGTKPETLGCRRVAGSASVYATDGDGGIDNVFGKRLLPLLEGIYSRPSEEMSGFSYLETGSDGRGTLYLGTARGVQFVIPLIDVRLAPPSGDALGTLVAIAPRDALVASVREHFNLTGGEKLCDGTTVQSIADHVRLAADMLVGGAADPQRECDGLSVAVRFAGTPVASVPPVPPGCSSTK